jgi:glucosamine--fructose-6-phosphate aminotransferase (isomerizing)
MLRNSFVQDVLSQPDALRAALASWEPETLEPIASMLRDGRIDRIILTGMGASLQSAYPAWLILAGAGLPAIWLDAAELIHHTPALLDSRSALWLFSQSGRSAEIVAALDLAQASRPAALLATVNETESPLGQALNSVSAAAAGLFLRAPGEGNVSTRTYINALALGEAAALCLLGRPVDPVREAILLTADAIDLYLSSWDSHLAGLPAQVGLPPHIAILGRGPSLATARAASLLLGEAAKVQAVAYQAGEFRHGPLELVGPELTVFVLAGVAETRNLNLALLNAVRSSNSPAFWIGSDAQAGWSQLARVPDLGLPLVEILPFQVLAAYMAQRRGIEPGAFLHIGKVTLNE